jgi:hypothetical protein
MKIATQKEKIFFFFFFFLGITILILYIYFTNLRVNLLQNSNCHVNYLTYILVINVTSAIRSAEFINFGNFIFLVLF